MDEDVTARTTNRSPELLVVGGGKGGVGKTCLAVNVGVTIARKGWRVVIVDADLSCSNVEAVLGTHARSKLDDFFYQKGGKHLERILFPTQYDNLSIIPGTTGLLDVANPRYQQKIALIRELKQLEADLVIVDLDAGAHLNTLDFFLMTETNGVLVITPEKTSIDNAFKFLRAALFRRVERFYQSHDVAVLLKRNESLTDFIESIKESRDFEEQTRKRICGELVAIARSFRPKTIVNRARNTYEAQIASNILAKHARRDLLIETENLGFVYFDKCVPEAINSGTPFVVSHPRTKISACVADIANRLGYF
jgi:flagellar biosynthesis protein FlhG